MAEENNYGSGKKPLWQWVIIYLIIGALVYGAIYYFVLAKPAPATNQQTTTTTSTLVAKNSVQITNFSFSPATLIIKVGETVTWTNQDGIGHSATADDKSFDTGILSQGKSGTITFSKAGTYTYHCSIHPSMRGTIIVQ